MIIADISRVLQTAVLLEYNGETIDQYCDRMYTLITEKQEAVDSEKTFIQLCSNHLLAQMKRTLIRLTISEKHFVMRILGRLIECKNLSELTSLVIAFYRVTMAEYTFEYLTKSLTHLNNAVNDFQEFDETIDNITNEIEDEKLDEKYLREGEQNSRKGPNRWNQYWNEKLINVNTESSSKCLRNNFYMPNLFEYVRKHFLNEVVIWTKICLKNVVVTKKSVSTLGKFFTINNTSNATSENFFKFIKSDKNLLKTPLITFIETLSDYIRNLQKRICI